MKYFDSLVHVTTDGSWFGTKHDASLDRLARSMEAVGPARACVVGIPGYNMPNNYILEVCRQSDGQLVPIAGCNPRQFSSVSDACRQLRLWVDEGFRGVKIHPRFTGVNLDEGCLDWLMEAAARTQLPIFLCTILHGMHRPSPARPVDLIDQLLVQNPETTVVLLHGATTDLLACADLVRLHQNALLDLSLTILRYRDSSLDRDIGYVLRTLDQRCVIGSDFPEYTPKDVEQRVISLMTGVSEEKVRNVMYANLEKMLGQDPV